MGELTPTTQDRLQFKASTKAFFRLMSKLIKHFEKKRKLIWILTQYLEPMIESNFKHAGIKLSKGFDLSSCESDGIVSGK